RRRGGRPERHRRVPDGQRARVRRECVAGEGKRRDGGDGHRNGAEAIPHSISFRSIGFRSVGSRSRLPSIRKRAARQDVLRGLPSTFQKPFLYFTRYVLASGK